MLLILLTLGILGLIVYAGVRIVVGWILPREWMRQIDHAIYVTLTFFGKLAVVAIAGLIIWVIWMAPGKP